MPDLITRLVPELVNEPYWLAPGPSFNFISPPSASNVISPSELIVNAPELIVNAFEPALISCADASNTPSISLIAPTKKLACVSRVTEPAVWMSA